MKLALFLLTAVNLALSFVYYCAGNMDRANWHMGVAIFIALAFTDYTA